MAVKKDSVSLISRWVWFPDKMEKSRVYRTRFVDGFHNTCSIIAWNWTVWLAGNELAAYWLVSRYACLAGNHVTKDQSGSGIQCPQFQPCIHTGPYLTTSSLEWLKVSVGTLQAAWRHSWKHWFEIIKLCLFLFISEPNLLLLLCTNPISSGFLLHFPAQGCCCCWCPSPI